MIWSNRRAVDQIVPSHPPEYPSPKIETYNPLVPKILIFRHLYSVFFKNLCYIGIGRYEKTYIGFLSVSGDKKISYIRVYRYRPIWKKAYWSYPGLKTKIILIVCTIYDSHSWSWATQVACGRACLWSGLELSYTWNNTFSYNGNVLFVFLAKDIQTIYNQDIHQRNIGMTMHFYILLKKSWAVRCHSLKIL